MKSFNDNFEPGQVDARQFNEAVPSGTQAPSEHPFNFNYKSFSFDTEAATSDAQAPTEHPFNPDYKSFSFDIAVVDDNPQPPAAAPEPAKAPAQPESDNSAELGRAWQIGYAIGSRLRPLRHYKQPTPSVIAPAPMPVSLPAMISQPEAVIAPAASLIMPEQLLNHDDEPVITLEQPDDKSLLDEVIAIDPGNDTFPDDEAAPAPGELPDNEQTASRPESNRRLTKLVAIGAAALLGAGATIAIAGAAGGETTPLRPEAGTHAALPAPEITPSVALVPRLPSATSSTPIKGSSLSVAAPSPGNTSPRPAKVTPAPQKSTPAKPAEVSYVRGWLRHKGATVTEVLKKMPLRADLGATVAAVLRVNGKSWAQARHMAVNSSFLIPKKLLQPGYAGKHRR